MALTHNAVAAQSVHSAAHAAPRADSIISELRLRPSQPLESFYRNNHSRALAFARSYLKNLEDAEDAVSEADVKLLEGETTHPHYMRALKQIVLNRLARSKVEARLFVSVDLLGIEDGLQEDL